MAVAGPTAGPAVDEPPGDRIPHGSDSNVAVADFCSTVGSLERKKLSRFKSRFPDEVI